MKLAIPEPEIVYRDGMPTAVLLKLEDYEAMTRRLEALESVRDDRALPRQITLEELRSVREKILELAQQYGAYDLKVFGSVARGESGHISDVDLLIKMEPNRSLLDMGGLLSDLENLLNCKVDLALETGLKPRMREIVLQEAVPL